MCCINPLATHILLLVPKPRVTQCAPHANSVCSFPEAKESRPPKEAFASQSSRSISAKSSHTKGKEPKPTQPRVASMVLGSAESTRMAVPVRTSSRFTGTLETRTIAQWLASCHQRTRDRRCLTTRQERPVMFLYHLGGRRA